MQSIKINRLSVFKHGKSVYDQIYHSGVNIIRGENGSGKSTIANFIYYVLGGDFTNWLPEALGCEFVIAEIKINNKLFTLKREISKVTMLPMDIYFGSYENAINSNLDGWNRYSFRRSDNKESFSQVLFKHLGFTEISTENGDFITLNQILRLLYIDQVTPIIDFIKYVDFDSPVLRRTVGYYLYGSHDDSLVNDERDIRAKKKELSELNNQHKIFLQILEGKIVTTAEINKELDQLSQQLEKLNKSIDTSQQAKDLAYKEANNKFTDKKNELLKLKNQSIEVSKNINNLKININDSKDFISELQNQSKSLETSIQTRNVLGLMPVSYCPSCLSKLSDNHNPNKCGVCGNDHDDDTINKAVKVKEEIDNQIKESTKLLQIKSEKLIKLYEEDKSTSLALTNLQKDINLSLKTFTTSYDQNLASLLTTKGEVKVKTTQLLEKKKNVYRYEEILNKISKIKLEIQTLEDQIKIKSDNQKNKSSIVRQKIRQYALEILKLDSLGSAYEASFINANKIEIDYEKNSYALDGRSHFSASSMVILKNAIRFAIFFASLDLKFMRYPRFILCDNIEDKGMVNTRSQQFQSAIVSIASRFPSEDYQIIFTTSMMNKSLDIADFTVGPAYSPQLKTLNVESQSTSETINPVNDASDTLPFENDFGDLWPTDPF